MAIKEIIFVFEIGIFSINEESGGVFLANTLDRESTDR